MTSLIDRPPEVLDPPEALTECRGREKRRRSSLAVVRWIDAEFPDLVISRKVQRRCSCEDKEIAHVEPRVTDRPRRHDAQGWKEAGRFEFRAASPARTPAAGEAA